SGLAAADPAAPAAAVQPACSVDDAASAAALQRDVDFLAAPERDGRAPGSPGDAATRRYLAERFRCLGLVPAGADGSYEQPFAAAGRATANLVGYIAGADAAAGEIILIGAHHDHVGDGHLGANDNASGVAALLAVAAAVVHHGAPHRTIAFVAFGGEEV